MANESMSQYKVVLLGEGRVGKTSILLRYVQDEYVDGRQSTLQASYLEKHVVLPDHEGNDNQSNGNRYPSSNRSRREALLSIWDTAGQERFHSLGPIYYRDARGAVLVYDITDAPSFDRVKKWTRELRKMVGDGTRICITILGNKSDLERHRAVDARDARRYAEGVGATYVEVSAKTGSGVEDAFVELTRRMIDTVKPSHRSKSTSLANASRSMGNGINLSAQDDIVDLSRKAETPASRCC